MRAQAGARFGTRPVGPDWRCRATSVAVVPPIEKAETAAAEKQGGLRYVGIDQLSAGAFQPRKNFAQEELDALAAWVEKSGVLQPLLVRPAGDGFEIIAGESRWRAAQQRDCIKCR